MTDDHWLAVILAVVIVGMFWIGFGVGYLYGGPLA